MPAHKQAKKAAKTLPILSFHDGGKNGMPPDQ